MKNTIWTPLPSEKGFTVSIPENHFYFSKHIVRGEKVLPGVAYIEMAYQAIQQLYPEFALCSIEDGLWLRPVICNNATCELEISLSPETSEISFDISYQGQLCGRGVAKEKSFYPVKDALDFKDADEITRFAVRRINRKNVYEAFSEMGIDYGRYFRRINYVDIHKNKAVALLSNNDGIQLEFVNMLDCAFQSGMAISIGEHTESLMPFSLGAIQFHELGNALNHHSYYIITEKKSPFRTNITICDEQYTPLITVHDLGVKPSLISNK